MSHPIFMEAAVAERHRDLLTRAERRRTIRRARSRRAERPQAARDATPGRTRHSTPVVPHESACSA